MSLMACGIVSGYFANRAPWSRRRRPVPSRCGFLRTFLGCHLRKSMGELYHLALFSVHLQSRTKISHAACACTGLMRVAALSSQVACIVLF